MAPGEKNLALLGAPDQSPRSETGAGLHGATLCEESTSMASFLDSQLIRFHSSSIQGPLITLQSCRGRRHDGAAVRQRDKGVVVLYSIFFFKLMTTCLCNVIAPPCLKGLCRLILIDPTGDVCCSVHGGLNTQSRKSQIGEGGKKSAAYLRQSHSGEITITGGSHGVVK